MSKRNGDKARFHRIRKQKIARRLSIRELRDSIAAGKATASAAATKSDKAA
jgi:hypothetical protein